MVIDFHAHIFPSKMAEKTVQRLEKYAGIKAHTDGTLTGLLNSMEDNQIDYSVVLPVVTKPEQFSSVNLYAKKINDKYSKHNKTKVISFGGIHPDSSDYKKELREICSLGLKGIKLHPDYQKTEIDDIRYMRILSYASELELIVSIHAGIDVGFPDKVHCTPKRIKNLINEVHPQNMILAHYGGFQLWDEVEQYLIGEDAYLDTSYMLGFIQEEQFLRILRNHGSEKILFATDSPWSGQKESLSYLKGMKLEHHELEKILFQNAAKLLKLE